MVQQQTKMGHKMRMGTTSSNSVLSAPATITGQSNEEDPLCVLPNKNPDPWKLISDSHKLITL
jgi:hypothetical protein